MKGTIRKPESSSMSTLVCARLFGREELFVARLLRSIVLSVPIHFVRLFSITCLLIVLSARARGKACACLSKANFQPATSFPEERQIWIRKELLRQSEFGKDN